MASTINSAISSVSVGSQKILLVLDAPTLLLATTQTSATELSSFVLTLREKVHSTLLVVEADAPLISAAAPAGAFAFEHAGEPEGREGRTPTPLEAEHAAFVASQAHVARLVVGCRALDTGVARDVSGVLSVRRGGDSDGDEEDPKTTSNQGRSLDEMEVLYHVQSDGTVRVFERGAGNVG